MYTVGPGSILEVLLRHRLNLQLVETTWHYRNVTSITDGYDALGRYLTAFDDFVWAQIRTGLSTDLGNTAIRAQWVFPTRHGYREAPSILPAGTVATPATPSGVAVVLRRRSEEAGRIFVGRAFVPGIAKADVAESQVTAAWRTANTTAWGSAGTTILTSVVYGDCIPVVWGRTTPLVNTPIIGAFVDPILRYQRRREVGVGE